MPPLLITPPRPSWSNPPSIWASDTAITAIILVIGDTAGIIAAAMVAGQGMVDGDTTAGTGNSPR